MYDTYGSARSGSSHCRQPRGDGNGDSSAGEANHVRGCSGEGTDCIPAHPALDSSRVSSFQTGKSELALSLGSLRQSQEVWLELGQLLAASGKQPRLVQNDHVRVATCGVRSELKSEISSQVLNQVLDQGVGVSCSRSNHPLRSLEESYGSTKWLDQPVQSPLAATTLLVEASPLPRPPALSDSVSGTAATIRWLAAQMEEWERDLVVAGAEKRERVVPDVQERERDMVAVEVGGFDAGDSIPTIGGESAGAGFVDCTVGTDALEPGGGTASNEGKVTPVGHRQRVDKVLPRLVITDAACGIEDGSEEDRSGAAADEMAVEDEKFDGSGCLPGQLSYRMGVYRPSVDEAAGTKRLESRAESGGPDPIEGKTDCGTAGSAGQVGLARLPFQGANQVVYRLPVGVGSWRYKQQ